MKRIICFILTLTVAAASALMFTGCGDKDKKDATEATAAATTAATTPTVKPAEMSTVTTAPVETLGQLQNNNSTEAAQPTEGSTTSAYYDTYGGLTGQQAILKAISYVGAGYQCVYYDQRYLRNQEAWYIGVQASEGEDTTVYYLYVNESSCVPVNEIPNIGGNNQADSGVFSTEYAGISEQEAIVRALDMCGDKYGCIYSDHAELNGVEYWKIGVQEVNNTDGEILTYYVNADSCFQQ